MENTNLELIYNNFKDLNGLESINKIFNDFLPFMDNTAKLDLKNKLLNDKDKDYISLYIHIKNQIYENGLLKDFDNEDIDNIINILLSLKYY